MSDFKTMVNRVIKEAGIDKFTIRDLRRSLRTVMPRASTSHQ